MTAYLAVQIGLTTFAALTYAAIFSSIAGRNSVAWLSLSGDQEDDHDNNKDDDELRNAEYAHYCLLSIEAMYSAERVELGDENVTVIVQRHAVR